MRSSRSGSAACNKTDADNKAANETVVENIASTDVNAATDECDSGCRQRAERGRQAVENAGNAVDNAGDAVANATENK